MCEVCIFAGTSEGRELTELLTGCGVSVYACVATEYGQTLLNAADTLTVSSGRLGEAEMTALFTEKHFDIVVDATHPYAPIVTENIRAACRASNTEYLRLLRAEDALPEDCLYAESAREAAELLSRIPGKILLTTGSKELAAYASLPDFPNRVYARVLPVEDSIAACRAVGLSASHILAMQGPFSAEMNTAMLRSIGAEILVTKAAGSRGGFPEKVRAASDTGAKLLVIGRPQQEEGFSYSEAVKLLCRRCGILRPAQVAIVGIGPGDRENRTLLADRAIRNADCLIGAKRMLEAAALPGQRCCEAIAAEKIEEIIRSHPECRRFAVVMAGDVGFYSGAKKLLPRLTDCAVSVIPGLSSLVTLCARLGIGYEDAVTVSLHGRSASIAAVVAREKKVFALVGGENATARLCSHLTEYGLGDVTVSVGEQLGYPEEKITTGTAEALSRMSFDSLSVALIRNPSADSVTHGLPDETFLRGSHADGTVVPMTKREIRSCAISQLGLRRDSVCWDIGAGTGSVSIEMGMQAYLGQVYAVEKKEAALSLLEENRRRLHADNVFPVAGLAPECCADLPAPTHVFIGGSSGKIREILELARQKNPSVRIVAAAIALETVAELTACCAELGFSDTEVITLTAARSRRAGPYTLMQGQNPVSVFTFSG